MWGGEEKRGAIRKEIGRRLCTVGPHQQTGELRAHPKPLKSINPTPKSTRYCLSPSRMRQESARKDDQEAKAGETDPGTWTRPAQPSTAHHCCGPAHTNPQDAQMDPRMLYRPQVLEPTPRIRYPLHHRPSASLPGLALPALGSPLRCLLFSLLSVRPFQSLERGGTGGQDTVPPSPKKVPRLY